MASDTMEALSLLCEEKHIDQMYLIDKLEAALAEHYKKSLKLTWGAKVTFDRTTGKFYVYERVPVDDSMILDEDDPRCGEYTEYEEVDITPKDQSRTVANVAKSVINEISRKAYRRQIFEEFAGRVGDIITGTVMQSTSEFTIIKIRDGVDAELPHYDLKRHMKKIKKKLDDGTEIEVEECTERNERPANERYGHNQRIKAVIIDVRNPDAEDKQVRDERVRPSIVVSRTHPTLLSRLFELEVPEIYDGVVEIKSIAREPGVRSKIAVASVDDRLDPVGACVGPKGSRVRTVVGELRGERVDVIPWSADIETFVAKALSPAKVKRVIVDPTTNYATVIVPDDQLSLAIGKEGQNARLAARLTGMHIDIKNESLASDLLAAMPVVEEAEDLIDDEELHRCEYVNENGIQCRNNARPGSHFCGVHAAMAAAGSVEVSDDPDSLI